MQRPRSRGAGIIPLSVGEQNNFTRVDWYNMRFKSMLWSIHFCSHVQKQFTWRSSLGPNFYQRYKALPDPFIYIMLPTPRKIKQWVADARVQNNQASQKDHIQCKSFEVIHMVRSSVSKLTSTKWCDYENWIPIKLLIFSVVLQDNAVYFIANNHICTHLYPKQWTIKICKQPFMCIHAKWISFFNAIDMITVLWTNTSAASISSIYMKPQVKCLKWRQIKISTNHQWFQE